MDNQLTKAIYAERSHTYHILTAIMEAALAEPIISKKFKQFIIDTQEEAEWRYFLVSDEMHEQDFRKENE